jgi:hypothetical protein
MTIRQQLMRELRRRLARISVVNGYATDIGTNLWYGQQTTPVPPVLPIIFYWDHFEQPAPQMGTLIKSVQIQIETYDHIVVPEEEAGEIDQALLVAQQMPVICNQHLADLTMALTRDAVSGQFDQRFGGLAHGLQSLESDPFFGIQPGALLWCGLNSQWTLHYQHALGDPYALTRA